MTKKQKKVLWRIIATAVLVAAVKLFSIGGVAGTVLYLAAYLIIGYDMKQGIDLLVARMERQYQGHLKKALISAIKMVGTQYAEMVRSETKA